MLASSAAAPRQRAQSRGDKAPTTTNLLEVAIPTTVATSDYPNYYDYSENIPPPPLPTKQDPKTHHNNKAKNMASMAMQVPIQPQQQHPQQRLVDTKGPSSSSSHVANPDDIILPPNKVDLDAARYRRAQQQESRESRRDRKPQQHDRKPSNASATNRPSSSSMGPLHLQHHQNGARPLSPDSPLLTPTAAGPNIQRLPTPSIPNSVLQPLDAKVVEYGTLMADAQADMARLDEEMRALQDRQREAEQRFLDAKAKHDDYRRQYTDVERALRGDFQARMNGGTGGGRGGPRRRGDDDDDDDDDVPPMPSMPSLGQYGTNGPNSRGGSGNLLNGNHNGAAANGGGVGPMPPRRTVSIQSDMVSQDSVRSHSKPRGRFSRLFGV